MATTAEAGPMALFFASGSRPSRPGRMISGVEESWGTGERIADGIPATASWHLRRPRPGDRLAVALGDRLGEIGLQIRAGLHAGEVELPGEDVGASPSTWRG